MATSQNGWPAGTREEADVTSFTVPGTAVVLPLNKTAGPALVAFAEDFHVHVQPLSPSSCWGYADRNIRGSATQVSNHASGTAIDLNADKHPLATPDLATFTPQQIVMIHFLLAERGNVIRWGGDYHGRLDSMHFEINVTPVVFKHWSGASNSPSPLLVIGSTGSKVADVQRAMNKLGNHLTVNGIYGRPTASVVETFQRHRKLPVTGTMTPDTWARLRAEVHPKEKQA